MAEICTLKRRETRFDGRGGVSSKFCLKQERTKVKMRFSFLLVTVFFLSSLSVSALCPGKDFSNISNLRLFSGTGTANQ